MLETVTENELFIKSDCDSLEQIEVLSFKYVDDSNHTRYSNVLKVVSRCENLSILYLQGNKLSIKDMPFLHSFKNLKKIDLSDNELETLPNAQVFAGMASLQFLYLHNNQIAKW